MSQRRAKYAGMMTRQLAEGARRVAFDFCGPELHMMRGDHTSFGRDDAGLVEEEKALPRAVRFAMAQIVQAAYPQGIRGRDSKVWAAWLEAMDDDGPTTVEVTLEQVQWLLKHAQNQELAIQPGLAQWREALATYLLAVTTDVPAGGDGQPST